ALDTAGTAVLLEQDPARGRAILERAVRATPMDDLDPTERPWGVILFLAAATEDGALARRARTGALQTMGQVGPDSVGVAAYFDALVATADRDWTTAAARMQEADRRLMVAPEEARFWLAFI